MRIIMIYELIPRSMHACHSEQNNIKLVHYWLISLNLLTLSYKCTLCYINCCIKVQKLWLFIIWMVRLKMNRLMQKSCDWFNNYYNFEYCIEQDSAVCGGQPVLSIHRKHQLVARQPERQMSVSDVKERLHYGRKSSKS